MNKYELNIRDHARFMCRTSRDNPDEIEDLTLGDILCSEHDYLDLAFPQPAMNHAALQLLAVLTQYCAQPADTKEHGTRIQEPMVRSEFEAVFQELASERWRILSHPDKGGGFMQGMPAKRKKSGALDLDNALDALLLRSKTGDKAFLNRPQHDWSVVPEYLPVLIFHRLNCFESQAGRGYLDGPNAKIGVRTMPWIKGQLRKTLWLNVISKQYRNADEILSRFKAENFVCMWQQKCDFDKMHEQGVPDSQVSPETGQLWLTARHYIHFSEDENSDNLICVVSGKEFSGARIEGICKESTQTKFGLRATDTPLPFFPNQFAPFFQVEKPTAGFRHHKIRDVGGFVSFLGSLLFACNNNANEKDHSAPVLKQYTTLLSREVESLPEDIDVMCFGYDMIGPKSNIHGAYKYSSFVRNTLSSAAPKDVEMYDINLGSALESIAGFSTDFQKALLNSIRMCTAYEVDLHNTESVIQRDISRKVDYKKVPDIARGAVDRLWTIVKEILVGDVLTELTPEQVLDSDHMANVEKSVRKKIEDRVLKECFYPVYNEYVHVAERVGAAIQAQRYLHSRLKRIHGN